MTTVTELASHVGKYGKMPTGRLTMRVRILDARVVYGQTQFKVTPVEGEGECWATNVKIEA